MDGSAGIVNGDGAQPRADPASGEQGGALGEGEAPEVTAPVALLAGRRSRDRQVQATLTRVNSRIGSQTGGGIAR